MIQVPPGPATPVLSDVQNGATVAVTPGRVLQVRLSARPGSGYGWRIVQGPPEVAVIRQGFGPAPGRYLRNAPSGTGQQVFDVRAPATPGRTVALVLAYKSGQGRMAFARVWRVRLRVEADAASLPGLRR